MPIRSSNDPFSSGKASWLGKKEESSFESKSSSSETSSREARLLLARVRSAMEDEGRAEWSWQRDSSPMQHLVQVKSRNDFKDR
mmetsp:Transcript_15169/g.20593  ORF Transcript_15169/g.20593 Transcript_15169/m.20593 type:complete len:84 (+) Transcript_15169:367-618(+)